MNNVYIKIKIFWGEKKKKKDLSFKIYFPSSKELILFIVFYLLVGIV